MANKTRKECGCRDKIISNDHDVHLHVEIENLKQKLVERDNHILTMETNFLNEADKFPNGEVAALREELITWQDKYKRLYDAHRRVQRVNQGLEDKLLRLVDICETEKNALTKDVATLSHRLADANYTVKKLTDDNERYKNDVALAIQFLQCKQTNFVSQKFDSLPNEVQAQVSSYVASKRKPEERKAPPEVKSIKVPIPTFPPTAMVYSIPKSSTSEKSTEEFNEDNPPVDIVSAAIMAKVLEERERERSRTKHCDTCTCSKTLKIIHHNTHHSISTQTGDSKNSLCLRCNSDLDNRATALKLVSNLAKPKSVPIYANEIGHQNNVAKVQPNNFLSRTDSSDRKLSILACDLAKNSVSVGEVSAEKSAENVFVGESENLNKSESVDISDRSSPTCTIDSNSNSGKSKGPRYCSLRVQSGSKNILLDNAQNNFAPVLYTRQRDKKMRRLDLSIKTHHSSRAESYSSEENKSPDIVQNQQRVAEWIQNNMDSNSNVVVIGGTQSAADPNNSKYKEMENNVKKFLFGESQCELLRNARYHNAKNSDIGKSSRSSSRTETDI